MATLSQGTLSVVGDILGPVQLGNTGIGQPTDLTALVSLTGTFTAATVLIEGVPLGQPLTQGNPPTPTSVSEWVLISSQGPLTSTGLVGSGIAVTVACNLYQQLRARLSVIGSGAIVGGIASSPFLTTTDTNTKLLKLLVMLNMQILCCQKELANKDDVEGFVGMTDALALLATTTF